MVFYVGIINQILYFSYDTFDKILQAFGYTWLQLVTGLAVVSVILRLFAANLVGSAMAIHQSHKEATAAQRKEKQKERSAKRSRNKAMRKARREIRSGKDPHLSYSKGVYTLK